MELTKLTKMPIKFGIRQSTLEEAACLYRFHEHQVRGVPKPPTEFAERGTTFHKMHEEYVNHLVTTRQECDYDAADSIAARHIGAEASSLFLEWTRRWFFDPESIYATEYLIKLDWEFKPAPPDAPVHEAPFSGTFDRLEIDGDTADIWDLKTHWAVFSPTTIQAHFYPWPLWKVMPNLQTVRFNLDFVRWGVVRSREFSRDELPALEAKVTNATKRILAAQESNRWPAIVNNRCSWCVLDCPLVADGIDRKIIGQIRSRDEAAEMAAELFVMESKAQALRRTLRSYAAEAGPLEIGNDIQLGFKRTSKIDYPARQISALNDAYGFDPLRALKSDSAELKRIAKKYPDYATKLARHGTNKGFTVLTFSDATTGDDADEREE